MATNRIVDCHAHIIDPRRFAYADGPGYTPRPDETGTREAFSAVLQAHKVEHALLVQPSCYGLDNAAMIDAMSNDPGRFKAIAVVSPGASDRELSDLAERGVVGVRFNLVNYDRNALAGPDGTRLLDRLKSVGWFAQIYADDEQWPELARLLRLSRVKILIDHFGVRDLAAGTRTCGFQTVLELGREGNATVKLSAPFRLTSQPGAYAQLESFVEALLESFGVEHCVWGSDWPFLAVRRKIRYGDLLADLERWLPNRNDRDQVLWFNPIRLFDFAG
jgi:predicted TIM-barrel fold metal-dependent hydrolase